MFLFFKQPDPPEYVVNVGRVEDGGGGLGEDHLIRPRSQGINDLNAGREGGREGGHEKA
jgi:hypothetical protein